MSHGKIFYMRHENTLDAAETALVVVDMQEAFRHSIHEFEQIASRISMAIRGFQILNLPVIVTEQYPKGLGSTAGEIRAVLPDALEPIEKTAFSSCGAAEFVAALEHTGARQVLVCGIEAHVCVNQTTHDLLARGLQVHLLTECINSRSAHNRETGLAKMQQSGALPSSIEMSLFELMRDAAHKQFKAVQKLIK